jgi:hypothetical protein
VNSNPPLQKSDMPSRASQRDEDCCHRATDCYDTDRLMFTYNTTKPS